MQRVLAFLRSSLFLKIIFAVFILQGVFFALAVNPSYVEIHDSGQETRGGGVVPDGNRHKAAIYYFANQPLLSGPTITNMEPEDLWMGELERFPSYLYYYVLSFPVRIGMLFNLSDGAHTILVRLVGLGFGVWALWVFRQIVRELKAGRIVTNLAVAALALTGSFAWLAPAENYDIFALLLWFLFLLASLRLFTRRDPTQLYWMLIWFLLGSVAKYTYIPFMGLAGLGALGLYVWPDGVRLGWQRIATHYRQLFGNSSRWLLAAGATGLLVAGGLFVERIGVNLVQYQSFNPSCAKVHSHEACMAFGVYERNYNRKKAIAEGTASYTAEFEPVSYTQLWLERYFTSMYAYQGHIWIYTYWSALYVGLATVLAAVGGLWIYVLWRRKRVVQNSQQYFVLGMALVMIVAQFVFNMRAFITFAGEPYAHQGRYLLGAIGFVYVLLLLIVAAALRAMSERWRARVLPVLVAVAITAVCATAALPSFFAHATTAEWYSPLARSVLPSWITHE
jgi:hypothetical protein